MVSPHLLTSPTTAPGQGRPWCVTDCRAAAATLDGRLRRRWSRRRPAVGVGGLALWHGHQVRRWCRPSSIVQAWGRHHSSLRVHLSSPLHLSVRAYSERQRWASRVGGGWAPNLPCPVSRSQSRMSMNDTRPWKLYMPPGMCSDVMYVCHSICQRDRDNSQLGR